MCRSTSLLWPEGYGLHALKFRFWLAPTHDNWANPAVSSCNLEAHVSILGSLTSLATDGYIKSHSTELVREATIISAFLLEPNFTGHEDNSPVYSLQRGFTQGSSCTTSFQSRACIFSSWSELSITCPVKPAITVTLDTASLVLTSPFSSDTDWAESTLNKVTSHTCVSRKKYVCKSFW